MPDSAVLLEERAATQGGPRQAGGMCWQEPYGSQQGQVQGPALGKDEPPAAELAGARHAGAALQ